MAIVAGMKVCSKCKQAKPVSDFHIDRYQGDKLKPACRLCTNAVKRKWRHDNADIVRQKRKEEARRNSERIRAYYQTDKRRKATLKHKCEKIYGITVNEFEAMMEASDGRCYICDRLPEEIPGHRHKRLGIDHDHATGRVRGLLCTPCNVMLGSAGDSQQTLRNAIKYLQQLFPNPTAEF